MNVSVFSRKKEKVSGTVYLVYLRVSMDNGTRFLVSTGLDCVYPPVGMSFPRQEKNAKAKTAALTRVYSECEDFCLRNREMPLKRLKEALSSIICGKDTHRKSVAFYIGEFASMKSGRTRGLYEGTKKKVESFDSAVTFECVDIRWLTSFEEWLGRTMSVNGLSIHMRNLRAVFNYAIDEELTTNYPFRKYSIKHEQTAKRNLTREQLIEIRDMDCAPFLEEYRDIFMLSFYLMGINAKDLFNLKKSDYRNGRITYNRAKTGRLYDIKVEPEAQRLIEKWKGEEWLLCPHDRYKNSLDYLSHFNRGLKHLGVEYKEGVGYLEKKGRYSFLSSYYSRHTWASLASELDIPVDVIGHALGHSDGRVTAIYINFNMKKVDEANRRVLDYIL